MFGAMDSAPNAATSRAGREGPLAVVTVPGAGRRRTVRGARRTATGFHGRAALRISGRRRPRRPRLASLRVGRRSLGARVVWAPTPPRSAQLRALGRPAALVLAGYLRVLDPGRKFAEPSIGRVLTVAPYRGIGFGRTLMAEGIARTPPCLAGTAGSHRGAATSRAVLCGSRLSHGCGAPYQEDDIAHRRHAPSGARSGSGCAHLR